MKSQTLSLIAVTTALAAVTGFAVLAEPDGPAPAPAAASAKAPRLPVERTMLACPAPSTSDLAETAYTAYTPAGGAGAAEGKDGDAAKGAAELVPTTTAEAGAEGDDPAAEVDLKPVKPLLTMNGPGRPVVAERSGAETPAATGIADGRLAPGWTAQQTTTVAAGDTRGVLGARCTAPGSDFWFPGASTADNRSDYVHLVNPDDTAAVADVELYGKNGRLKAPSGEVGQAVKVPARGSVPLLLSTLTDETVDDVTVHVGTRVGRVSAAVQATDDKAPGADWLQAGGDPAARLVLPGIPADATNVRLYAFTPDGDDAELKVELAGKSGSFTPAGHESVYVKGGMTASVDLGDVTRGEAGSLVLTPTRGDTPVVAALRVTRGKGADQEFAFVSASDPVGARATATDNRAKGSTLSLVAPRKGESVRVKVTASAGSGGGEPASKTFTVKGGTTTAVVPPVPEGLKGRYALTLEPEDGSGPVYAARTLSLPEDGIPMFTVQTLSDDRGSVAVPEAGQDLSVLD
ncbi:DUF5719 family protein [Streptomyces sp. NPDC060194]|uniref:DUF5719 family protein n=1 Tax=Streptomyces sp. NPDC060194 TaxID=3347069 RepID=UPI00365516FF